MLKKVYVVVDVADENERQRTQEVMNDISNMRVLNGGKILSMYPYFKRNQGELVQLFRIVGTKGVKALMSGQGIALITKLARG